MEKVSNLTSSNFWRRHSNTEVRRLEILLEESEVQHFAEALLHCEPIDISREER